MIRKTTGVWALAAIAGLFGCSAERQAQEARRDLEERATKPKKTLPSATRTGRGNSS